MPELLVVAPRRSLDIETKLRGLADPAVGRLLDASARLLAEVALLIEACLNDGRPRRRALRPQAGDPGLGAISQPRRGLGRMVSSVVVPQT